jgi:hypothetical protein
MGGGIAVEHSSAFNVLLLFVTGMRNIRIETGVAAMEFRSDLGTKVGRGEEKNLGGKSGLMSVSPY